VKVHTLVIAKNLSTVMYAHTPMYVCRIVYTCVIQHVVGTSQVRGQPVLNGSGRYAACPEFCRRTQNFSSAEAQQVVAEAYFRKRETSIGFGGTASDVVS